MTTEHELRARDIAVIGMAGRFPGAPSIESFWRNLAEGRDAVTFFSDAQLAAAGIPPEEFGQPNYVKAGMILDGVEEFDAGFFGYNPGEAALLDPQQRLFLETAWSALEHAGYAPQRFEGLIGIYAGAAWNTYLLSNLTTHRELFDAANVFQTFITSDKDFMPTRVSYKLNLRGPSLIVQTSCSTSLVAIHLACIGLLTHDCDMALAGGVTVKVPTHSGYLYQEGGLASPDGHCRSFDAGAQGTIFGSGVGAVVLKRLADALDDGDMVLAVIRGSAINNDGAQKVSYTAPGLDGQAEVIAAAQAAAEVDPETIGYVEAHGTATALGDPIEVAALTRVFRAATEARQFCALGSVKSNIGHLDAAAGVAGFIKTVLALQHRQLPPSLHYQAPNPQIDFAQSPFYVNTALTEWPANGAPRRAGVSSFGVGGTNAHVILEEAPAQPPTPPAEGWQVLPLSARSVAALDQLTADLAAHLRAHPDLNLADVAYTLQVGRKPLPVRRAVLARTSAQAVAAIEERDPQLLLSASAPDAAPPLAFLFPGQGAQFVGMGRDLYATERVFREWVDRCAELLTPHLGLDIRHLIYPDDRQPTTDDRRPTTDDHHDPVRRPLRGRPVEKPREGERGRGAEGQNGQSPISTLQSPLNQTQYTQPALFVVSYALAQLWMSRGVRPQALLGHSLGEYVAACLAGVFSLEDALLLVAERGRLMQSLPQGAMLSIALDQAELAPFLTAELSLAAVNGPERCTVAGPPPAIAALEARLSAREVNCRRLPTERAFHSPMVEAVLPAFRAVLARVRLQAPQLPVVSNMSGTWLTEEQATDPAYWARQMRAPVQFGAGLATLAQAPGRVLLEVGPGTTLSSLARQQLGQLPIIASLGHREDTRADDLLLATALGRLWLAGVEVAWEATEGAGLRQRVALPTYPFERRRFWIEPGARGTIASPQPDGVVKRANMDDWFYVPAWRRALRPPPTVAGAADTPPGPVLLFVDAWGVGAALGERLAGQGRQVLTVVPGDGFARLSDGSYTIDPQRPDDYAALLDGLGQHHAALATVVHLWSLAPPRDGAPRSIELRAALALSFTSLLYLVQAYGQREPDPPLRLVLVSNATQSVGGKSVLQAEKAPALGLCRVIPQEYTQIICCSIDLELPGAEAAPADWLIEALADDCEGAPGGSSIAYRNRRRWVEQFEPLPLAAPPSTPLRAGGSYLLIDGLEGIGFALAETIAHATAGQLVLFDQAGFPERAEWAEWAAHDGDGISRKIRNALALEALGATVAVVGGDYSAEADLRRAVEQALARAGALHGVIHCAGTGGEQRFHAIQELTPDEVQWHLSARAASVVALARALGEHRLDFCCLTSSLSTALGGRGYAAYAAANCFCDSFARQHNRHSPTRWLSIGWDAWKLDEPDGLTALSASLSELALDAAEIGAVLLRALAAPDLDHVLISTGDLARRMAQDEQRIAGLRVRAQPNSHAPRHPRPALPTDYVAPTGEGERAIAAIWERVLGFEQVGVLDNFFELGGDSLLAVRVVAQIKAALEIDLPVARLYQGLTVRALAAIIADGADGRGQRAAQQEERREQLKGRRAFQKQQRVRREQ